jgi:hypothetical protein
MTKLGAAADHEHTWSIKDAHDRKKTGGPRGIIESGFQSG